MNSKEMGKLWQNFAINIEQAWYATPFHYFGQAGMLWGGTVLPESWRAFFNASNLPASMVRAPFGGMVESVLRRRRKCVSCGKYFWRQGAFNPLAGVNIFEEHCSQTCADDELQDLPF